MAFDFKKEYKESYLPPKKPGIVTVPTMNYIAVRGKGNPNDDNGEYKAGIGLLYGIAFTIKMSDKGSHKIGGYFQYVVPPLEGFWWQGERHPADAVVQTDRAGRQDGSDEIDYNHKENFHFISVIRLPDFVTREDFDWAVAEATKKKKSDFSKVEFFTYDEGECVQCMHIGSFDDEPQTIAAMHEYAKQQGYELDITDIRYHHEIYLSDPRRCEVSKLKTVVRHPVKKNTRIIMNTTDGNIDGGKAFDWGKTSADYAKFRDIYPQEFYDKIINRKLCISSQSVLDMGTGTGVLPRNMYRYGAKWTGTDISENQIEQAKILSKDMDIAYYALSAENANFPDHTFDVLTACQCFWYFEHEQVMPKFYRMLKADGRILVLYMAWLPFEDKIAGASEKLVLKYSPAWTGAGETIHPIWIPDCYDKMFELTYHEEYPLTVHFTRESWNGRMKACRGIGASLSKDEVAAWEQEHMELLTEIAPAEFDILHYGAIAELKKR